MKKILSLLPLFWCLSILIVKAEEHMNSSDISLCDSKSSNSCTTAETDLSTTESNVFNAQKLKDATSALPELINETTTVNTTNTMNNLTTTTLPPSNATTSSPQGSKTKENNSAGNICNCDITMEACDINCCCDNDCTPWERSSFSDCIPSEKIVIPGHCYSTHILYKNNNPFPTIKSENGLFCIERDNFPDRNRFMNQQVIKSATSFEKVWKRKKTFSWPAYEQHYVPIFTKTEYYKYGQPVWKYNNVTGQAETLNLPAPNISPFCRNTDTVLYLKNSQIKCLQFTPTTEEECLENKELSGKTYCQDLVLIASPASVNSSEHFQGSPDEVFVNVKKEVCDDKVCNDTDTYPDLHFNKSTKACHNMVMSVRYDLRHNGSLGISEAFCKVMLGSLSRNVGELFYQKFQIEFSPSRLVNKSSIFKRSGFQGYRQGFPVITKKKQGENGLDLLTILDGPNCKGVRSVFFGENVRTQCTLDVPANSTNNCTFFDELIVSKITEGFGDIGVSGDPREWLDKPMPQILSQGLMSPCVPATRVSLAFLYSYVGPLNSPEAKIVGASCQMDTFRSPICSPNTCRLRLVTTITFTDISRPAVSKFATAPHVKIKLPRDFFYPFSSSASNNAFEALIIYLITFIVFIDMLIFKT